MKMGSSTPMGLLSLPYARHELGRVVVAVVDVAANAGIDEPHRIAGFARVQVAPARFELRHQRLEPRDLRARLVELLRVYLAQARHRTGRARAPRVRSTDLLDLGEREPHVLELADPSDPHERLRVVQAGASTTARGGLEQAELL